jgi:uncharacterized protein (TIGR02099 family)
VILERPLRFVVSVFWEAAAVTVIAAAVLVTLLRFMLPQITEYRTDIEQLIGEYTAQPVVIEEMTAEWRGWTPQIHLTNIKLLDHARERTLTRFSKATVNIDLLASLLRRQVIPGRMVVSGVQLSLLRSPDGKIRIEGVAPESEDVPSVRQNALAYWLQNQKNLEVASAQITWHDQKSLLQPVVFSNVHLVIRSDGERRQLQGSARLPEEMGEAFDFNLDARGDLLTTDWSGALHIEGRGIDPTVLLNYQRWLGLKLAEGTIDFELWSDWQQARLETLDGRFALHDVEVGVQEYRFGLGRANGNLRALRLGDTRWSLAVEKLNVSTANGDWPESDIALSLVIDPAAEIPTLLAHASFLRLDDLAPLMPNVDAIPETIRGAIAQIRPRGELHDLRIGYFPSRPPPERFYLQGRFERVETLPFAGVPGVEGLRGAVKADARGGVLRLAATPMLVDAKATFAAPLRIEELSGDVRWRSDAQQWQFVSEDLRIRHRGLSVDASGTLDWAPGESPRINVLAEADGGDLEFLHELAPKGLMPRPGYEWTVNAVQGGRVTSGVAVLRGPLDAFPFNNSEGVFKVRLTIDDGLLQFSRRWPRLEELDAEILFEGRALAVHGASAKLLGADLARVSVSIPDLTVRERQLRAHGEVRSQAPDARRIVYASPLEATLGQRLEFLEMSGDLALDLALEMPLQTGARPHFEGRLDMHGNALSESRLRIDLEGIEGALTFAGGDWRAEQVRALYQGRPVELNLSGSNRPEIPSEYRMSGMADRDLIRFHLERYTPRFAQWLAERHVLASVAGQTAWEAVLTVHKRAADVLERTLRINTDLRGLAIDLPAPLGKTAGEARPFRLENLPEHDGRGVILLSLAPDIEARLTAERAAEGARRIAAAAVGFGVAPSDAAHSGVHLGGRLGEFSFSAWRQAFAAAGGASPARSLAPRLLTTVDLEFGALEAFGLAMQEVRLRAETSDEAWLLDLGGPHTAGHVVVPFAPAPENAIAADMERMALARHPNPTDQADFDPKDVPPLTIRCASFAFGEVDLGAMALTTRPADSGLQLEALSFRSPDFDIDAAGEWSRVDGSDLSRFDITVRAQDLGRLLDNFGYDVTAVEGGQTELDIHAAWAGTPADFALAQLNGDLRLKVTDGRFLDIDPKAGRLFGLLSMQSLRRRILLDFDDLFRKGLSFDRVEGVFDLEHGNAFTNNLSMDGPSARIEVSGRTGLADQDYDQIVTVTPQFADSLPVASAVFGPVGAGVGAVLYLGQKMFKSIPDHIDRILSRQYTVTGHWDDPVIERVKEEPTEASLDG